MATHETTTSPTIKPTPGDFALWSVVCEIDLGLELAKAHLRAIELMMISPGHEYGPADFRDLCNRRLWRGLASCHCARNIAEIFGRVDALFTAETNEG